MERPSDEAREMWMVTPITKPVRRRASAPRVTNREPVRDCALTPEECELGRQQIQEARRLLRGA